jgi:hypothetical protein
MSIYRRLRIYNTANYRPTDSLLVCSLKRVCIVRMIAKCVSSISLLALLSSVSAFSGASLSDTGGFIGRRGLFNGPCSPFTMRRLQQMGGEDDVQPAPASIGSDVPLTYFGELSDLIIRAHGCIYA